jgi:hypothetical protein
VACHARAKIPSSERMGSTQIMLQWLPWSRRLTGPHGPVLHAIGQLDMTPAAPAAIWHSCDAAAATEWHSRPLESRKALNSLGYRNGAANVSNGAAKLLRAGRGARLSGLRPCVLHNGRRLFVLNPDVRALRAAGSRPLPPPLVPRMRRRCGGAAARVAGAHWQAGTAVGTTTGTPRASQ